MKLKTIKEKHNNVFSKTGGNVIREQHRMRKSPEYSNWAAMKQRCYHTKSPHYSNYGARGIKVCDRWKNSFLAFYEDMGPRPTEKHTIERINNDGNYEPQNCRWATRQEQNRNMRANHVLTFDGKSQIVRDWANELGINYQTLMTRLRLGWSVHDVLAVPIDATCRHSKKTLTLDGRTQTLARWAQEVGLSYKTLSNRVARGWPTQEALFRKAGKR